MSWIVDNAVAVAAIAGAALGTASAVGHVVVFFLRRGDQAHIERIRLKNATALEEKKGQITREVTEALKTQESRLRVDAELQLRAHDRSWALLRDILAGTFEAENTLRSFALAATLEQHTQEQYDRALAAVVKVQTLIVTAPPEHDAASILTPMMAASQKVIRMTLEKSDDERVELLKKAAADLETAIGAAGVVAKTWNASLWKTSTTLPVTSPTGSLAGKLRESLGLTPPGAKEPLEVK